MDEHEERRVEELLDMIGKAAIGEADVLVLALGLGELLGKSALIELRDELTITIGRLDAIEQGLNP